MLLLLIFLFLSHNEIVTYHYTPIFLKRKGKTVEIFRKFCKMFCVCYKTSHRKKFEKEDILGYNGRKYFSKGFS